jgi:hypothetical protein
MLRLEPCPMASMAMTEATPMMIPNMVRNARSLLLAKALKAILKRFVPFISHFLISHVNRRHFSAGQLMLLLLTEYEGWSRLQ